MTHTVKLEHLEQILKIKRHKHHPLLHQIHKEHKISRKTLFYVKEYGPHSNATKTIIKESIKILVFASVISSFGGIAIENIKTLFISIIPLVILLPTLNDIIGDYGTIISSRFSTMLHEGKAEKNPWKDKEVQELFLQIMIVAIILALISSSAALAISYFSNYAVTMQVIIKILTITLLDVAILVFILFIISIIAGIYFFKKGEDPNNFLIPITTSVADFGNMIILLLLIKLFF